MTLAASISSTYRMRDDVAVCQSIASIIIGPPPDLHKPITEFKSTIFFKKKKGFISRRI